MADESVSGPEFCERCGESLRPRSVGRPARYCSVRCRQQAYRVRRRMADQGLVCTLAGQVQDVVRQLEDNTRLIRILARGWTPPDQETSPSLTDLAGAARELAVVLYQFCARLDSRPAAGREVDEIAGNGVSFPWRRT
jgi:hypothetical protein